MRVRFNDWGTVSSKYDPQEFWALTFVTWMMSLCISVALNFSKETYTWIASILFTLIITKLIEVPEIDQKRDGSEE